MLRKGSRTQLLTPKGLSSHAMMEIAMREAIPSGLCVRLMARLPSPLTTTRLCNASSLSPTKCAVMRRPSSSKRNLYNAVQRLLTVIDNLSLTNTVVIIVE